MVRRASIMVWLLLGVGCGENAPANGAAGASTTGGVGSTGGAKNGDGGRPANSGGNASAGSGGAVANAGSGGAVANAGSGGLVANGGRGGNSGRGGNGGDGGNGGNGGNGGTPRPPPTGTPGKWEDVTSAEMDPALFTGDGGFGVGNVVTDPARPSDMYVGGYGSIWKSTNYGLTWTKLASDPNPPSLALGHVLAVAGTTPATLWMANVYGEKHVFRSTDGGNKFTLTGDIAEQPDAASLYSIVVDPGDASHLISGLHEQDRVLESTDAGDTWHFASGAGFPSGGKSWFPFFIDTGDATTTRQTWFAIAQDGASAVLTRDGGQTWVKPKGIENLQHPHGCSGLYQRGQTLFVAGNQGPGDGVYRSSDLGDNWTRVSETAAVMVWGSSKNVYAMWGWACAKCTDGARYQTAAQPGDSWSMGATPPELSWGPNSVATTSDGTHQIFVGSMWARGLWRYVEP